MICFSIFKKNAFLDIIETRFSLSGKGNTGFFSQDVLGKHVDKLFSYDDYGRIADLILGNLDWLEFIALLLDQVCDIGDSNVYNVVNTINLKYKSLKDFKNISLIGHIGDFYSKESFPEYSSLLDVDDYNEEKIKIAFLKILVAHYEDILLVLKEIKQSVTEFTKQLPKGSDNIEVNGQKCKINPELQLLENDCEIENVLNFILKVKEKIDKRDLFTYRPPEGERVKVGVGEYDGSAVKLVLDQADLESLLKTLEKEESNSSNK